MDTSEEYIKMCEKAYEIQVLSKREAGNFYYDFRRENLYVLDNIVIQANVEGKTIMPDDIWLPRQDQLQEMLNIESNKFGFQLLKEYMNKKEMYITFYKLNISWEIFWLFFVMEEKFNKNWNIEKQEWEKIY